MTQTYKCPVLVQFETYINLLAQIKFHSPCAHSSTSRQQIVPFIIITISQKEYTRGLTIHNYIYVGLLNLFTKKKFSLKKNCVLSDGIFRSPKCCCSPKVHTRRRIASPGGPSRNRTSVCPPDTCSAACPNKYLVFAYPRRGTNACGDTAIMDAAPVRVCTAPFKPPRCDAGAKRLSKLHVGGFPVLTDNGIRITAPPTASNISSVPPRFLQSPHKDTM